MKRFATNHIALGLLLCAISLMAAGCGSSGTNNSGSTSTSSPTPIPTLTPKAQALKVSPAPEICVETKTILVTPTDGTPPYEFHDCVKFGPGKASDDKRLSKNW